MASYAGVSLNKPQGFFFRQPQNTFHISIKRPTLHPVSFFFLIKMFALVFQVEGKGREVTSLETYFLQHFL